MLKAGVSIIHKHLILLVRFLLTHNGIIRIISKELIFSRAFSKFETSVRTSFQLAKKWQEYPTPGFETNDVTTSHNSGNVTEYSFSSIYNVVKNGATKVVKKSLKKTENID